MTERKTDPPRQTPKPPRPSGSARSPQKLSPDQYEIKIRWQKASRVLDVTPTGVKFEFETSLKVGVMYPVTLTAPGVSFSTTVEVTRCQLTAASGHFFLVEGRFFPYVG